MMLSDMAQIPYLVQMKMMEGKDCKIQSKLSQSKIETKWWVLGSFEFIFVVVADFAIGYESYWSFMKWGWDRKLRNKKKIRDLKASLSGLDLIPKLSVLQLET